MAEPTETRKDLRRALGRQMGMRFYRYTSEELVTSQIGVVVVAAFLVQRDDFWNRSWFYELANDETRMIIDSDQSSKNVTLEFTPTVMGTPATLTTALGGANNDLLLTAIEYGTDGNSITLTYVDGGTGFGPGTATISVTDTVITVTIDDGITTSAEVLAALLASSDVTDLVSAAHVSGNDGTGTVVAGGPWSLTGGTGTLLFEILDFYSPKMVHEAINEAMRNAWPEFFETKEDFTLCVARDMMEYDISSLSAFMVFQVWVERPSSVERFSVTSGTTTTCILTTTDDISHLTTSHWISFYDGTGKGYSKQISAVNNATKEITWVGALTTAPGSTTLVSITNPTKKDEDWYPVHACDFDNKQWPDKMRFKAAYDNQFAGSRIMIRYITVPSELDTDAATTAVPIDFVLSRARAALYDWHKDDADADRARFDGNFTDQMIKSEAIKAAKAFQAPDQLFWTEDDPALAYADSDGDPLDWSGF